MSFTVWFTGLPCSGKTTLSRRLYNQLKQCNCQVHLMDGDAVRAQLPRPLGFSKEDRDAHGRRLGALAQTMNDKGVICLVAAITPYARTREHNRGLLANYVEVFCSCPVAVAESRDSRGLYAKAKSGKISHFTGVSDPYEEPGITRGGGVHRTGRRGHQRGQDYGLSAGSRAYPGQTGCGPAPGKPVRRFFPGQLKPTSSPRPSGGIRA